MVRKQDIILGLKDLGLAKTDIVLVHSSFSSFGYVEGGADTVIDALMEVVDDDGGILMPSFPKFIGGEYGLVENNSIVFDLRISPSAMGKITDVFWRKPGVRRSVHPTHSVAAWGDRALQIIQDHQNCLCSCGEQTPFHKNCLVGGKILLIGVTHSCNTTLHTIEDVNGALTRSISIFYPKVIDYEGKVVTVPTRPHLPGVRRRYEIMDDICKSEGIQIETKVGKALLKLIMADKLLKFGSNFIKEDPLFLIDMEKMA